jgi:hypothetical protein
MEPACERFRARLQDALDEPVTERVAERTLDTLGGEHTATCAGCREALEAFRELDRVLASEPAAEPPAELAAAVRARVAIESRAARVRARASVLAGAAAVALVGVAIDVFGGALASGFEALLVDARGLARIAGARSLELAELPRLELPEIPSLPGATGTLATLALAGALGLAAAEALWWHRARRAGGAA